MPVQVCSISVLSKDYVFDPRPRFPFRIAVKRYWVGGCPDVVSRTQEDVLTLVFMHGNGAHKEQWEPTIQRLFEHQQRAAGRTILFHDMWSLDMPNQGDSAILNEEVLRWGFSTCEYHARAVHAFLAGLGNGVDVDFSKRSLVLAGHSMGGPTSILATTYYPLLKISSLHLIEPFLPAEDIQTLFSALSKVTVKRRDIWPNAEDAFRTLRERSTLRNWDERIIRLLVTHGLRLLPTMEYPDLKDGVTLKCTKQQEAATFRDYVTPATGYKYLPHVLKEIPTHIIFGTVRTDLMSEQWRQDVLHVASGGISNFASVTKIPGAGHMILQTHPDAVADVIWKSLTLPHECLPRDNVIAKL